MKKTLSVLLTLLCVLGMTAISVFHGAALEDYPYQTKDCGYSLDENGNATLMAYLGESTDWVLPDSVDGHPVTDIDLFFFNRSASKPLTVTFPNTIETLGSFSSCESAESVTAVKIGSQTKTIDSLAALSSLKTVGFRSDSHQLKTICRNAMPTSLESIDLSGVETIESEAFSGNRGMTALTIPGSVKTIGESAFARADALKSVVMEEGVESIGENIFSDSTVVEVSLPSTLKVIPKYAFRSCFDLTRLSLADGIETISALAFYDCRILMHVNIPKSVSSIGQGAFRDCFYIKDFTVDEGNAYYHADDGVLFETKTKTLMCYPGFKGGAKYVVPSGTKAIAAYAFPSNSALTSLGLQKDIESIGPDYFYRLRHLEEIKVSSQNTHFTDRDGVLYTKDLSRLIKYPSAKEADTFRMPTKTKEIEQFALAYTSVNHVIFSSSLEVIGDSALMRCTLQEAELPSTLKAIGSSAFYFCDNLREVTFSGDELTEIGDSAFALCSNMERVSPLPSRLTEISKSLFYFDEKLTDIEIPDGVTKIGHHAFGNCYGLTAVTIPGSVQKLEYNAFERCFGLTDVTICDGVAALDKAVFKNCTGLKRVTIPKSVTEIGYDLLSGCPDDAVIYGYEDTAAQRYAESNGIAFQPLWDSGYAIGDANLDGAVDISDATAIQKHVAGIEPFTSRQLTLADVNGDGVIDITDATHLQKYIAGISGTVLG